MTKFNEVINDNKPTLVDFFATWCGPCKVQAPILEQVKAKLGDKVNIVKIDIDKNEELAQVYNIRSVPTLIIFQRGEAVWRGYGVHQANQIEEKLYEHIAEENRVEIS